MINKVIKDKRLNIRMSAQEMDALRSEAKKKNIAYSKLVRKKLFS